MESKNKYLIMLFIFIAVIIITGTFAWLTYRSKKTALVFTVGSMDGMSVTLKPYQITASLTPTNDYTTEEYVNVTANNKNSNVETFELYYEIDEIDTELIDEGFKYTIVKSTDNWSTQTEVKTGNFSRAVSGDILTIYSENISGNNTTYDYKVYLWIDSSDGNQSSMQGKAFEGSLKASITTCLGPETLPALDMGMIPVTIADNGTVTTVSPSNSNWYNYCEKKWANAVLVKENADAATGSHSRSYYKNNSTNGTNVTVTDTDILAYFVWIPRYSYKIWTLDASSDHTGQEQTIDIKFVNKNIKDAGTSVGDYYTHPAFTFGSQELYGIWVGKFETSVDSSSTCYTSPSDSATRCNITQSAPRILPNVDSLRYQTIGNQYKTAMIFSGGTMNTSTYITTYSGNNTFGLTSNTDSHMMKNSEWGAVTYLSHSNYGINTEIRKNNYRESSSNYYRTSTGCGADVANANTETSVITCAIPFGYPSNEIYTYPQSTTGDISGIFDMSGGAHERVMGHYGTNGDNYGFDAGWFTTSTNSKYYDSYPSSVFTGDYSTNMTFCTFTTCGGHALNETKSWYSDSTDFVSSSRLWSLRGGGASNKMNAGAFNSFSYNGLAHNYYSFRVVLANVGS